jgi:mediator of RNA polymerase II transcription subunit 7
MSEFPFPPERLWSQYEEGPSAGPPPPAPVQGDFMIFGAALQTATPQGLLDAANIPRHFDGAAEPAALGRQLTQLNGKMMRTFLELLDEVLTNPTVAGLGPDGTPLEHWVPLAAEKSLETLKELFLNFHHLLNSHRPAQAKAHLLRLLEEQKERRSDANSRLQAERAGLEQQLADSIRKLRAAGLKDIERLCATATAAPAAAAPSAATAAAAAGSGGSSSQGSPAGGTAKRKAPEDTAGDAAAAAASGEHELPGATGATEPPRLSRSAEDDERLRKHLRQ